MGYRPEPTSEMGEYRIEVRAESVVLHGTTAAGQAPIFVYDSIGGDGTGSVELLCADLPKIRAALERAERVWREQEA